MNEDFNNRLDVVMGNLNIGWTCREQARQMAAEIFRLRPAISVEIGVYGGKGLIALALAHKEIGYGKAIGIDPWSREAFCAAEQGPLEFQDAQHCENVYQQCLANIKAHGVEAFCEVIRAKSDDVEPPKEIGFIRIDGDHAGTAMRDLTRFCPNVIPGGVLHLDDMNWTDGATSCGALPWLTEHGWNFAYGTETGAAFKRG